MIGNNTDRKDIEKSQRIISERKQWLFKKGKGSEVKVKGAAYSKMIHF